jgi:hypothetical protein
MRRIFRFFRFTNFGLSKGVVPGGIGEFFDVQWLHSAAFFELFPMSTLLHRRITRDRKIRAVFQVFGM